jgi:phosphopantothenoylcysteine decarboxylase/phosphopantothenate--cysteine ligase
MLRCAAMSQGGEGGRHVLLGVSGAIAAYRAADVVRELRRGGAEVTVAMTRNAAHFVTPFLLANLSGRAVITDQYQPDLSDVHHVNLAFTVDLLLCAPASADLLARMAQGIADDFLTTFYLATEAPVLVAPAMNTRMWQHPATRANVLTLRERGVAFVGPVEGELATLHSGIGRLAPPAAIAEEALARLRRPGPLAGQVVLVTAGPTAEDIDPVRTISNRSSGRMGFAVAAEARARGARVILVSGPTEVEPPAAVELRRVRSAAAMKEAVMAALGEATVVIMTAAVSDFRPERAEPRKVKKEGVEELTLRLVRTDDILAEVGRKKGRRLVVGFAAEDGDLEARARHKLERKHLDLVVANDISRGDTGFAAEENEVLILDAQGGREELSKRPKREVAARLLERIEGLLAARGA